MQVFIGILPELLALVFSACVAIIGYAQGMTLREVSIQTIFSILVFYLIGLVLKSTFSRLHREAIISVMKKSYEKYRDRNANTDTNRDTNRDKENHSVNYAVGATEEELNQLAPDKPNYK